MEPAEYLGDGQGGGIQPLTPCAGCIGCGGCVTCVACSGCDCSAQNGYWIALAGAVIFVGFGLW